MDVDLTVMPQGQRYEDRYQGYMDVFKRIAETPAEERVWVNSPPWSWVPLLWHLRCDMATPQYIFDHCSAVDGALARMGRGVRDRTLIEVLCGFRPECVDALWKCDMQWKTQRAVTYPAKQEFIVTNNGSFHRREVLDYMAWLRSYKPTKRNVVLVPCAADKPYPSPLHRAVMDIMPDDFYIMNATGVVGLVPQDLWHVMPHYDSGIPNRWRLYETARDYFTRNDHATIIVYCDFYNEAIYHALRSIGQLTKADFILPVKFYADYVDLLDRNWLAALSDAFNGANH